MIRRLWLIARTIFTEALRRREIYVIVLVTIALLVAVSAIHFFNLAWLHKFYFEIALQVMSLATTLTVIVLAARQLPREFERRTIYPLLAKPVSRWEFILGKYFGVVGAGIFCLAMFMTVFCASRFVSGGSLAWPVFAQFIYMQILAISVLTALAFLLSMLMALDATIVTTMLLYLLGQVLTNALLMLHDYVGSVGRALLLVLNYTIPQPALFDLSAKVIHEWPPVSCFTMLLVTLYALMFVVPYLGLSYGLFRRRPL